MFPLVYQLIYEDLVERVKEKEEKEARKLQRLADEFTNLLRSLKVYLTCGDFLFLSGFSGTLNIVFGLGNNRSFKLGRYQTTN